MTTLDVGHFRELLVEKREAVAAALEHLHKENSRSLEDETGSVQVIVWPKLKAQLRGPLLRSKLMAVKGTWQRDGDVRNLIAGHVEDLTGLLGGLATASRDFH